jgi:ribosomal protein S12 methylthiotransferase accessory factor
VRALVVIVGVGLLADRVYTELSDQFEVVRQMNFKEGIVETADLVLVLHDAWHPSIHQEAEEVLQSAGIPWLRGFVSFGEGVVGPLVRGIAGCSQCADLRRLMAGHDRKEMRELIQRIAEREKTPSDAWASRTGFLQVALLLVEEAQRVLHGGQARTQG